MRYGLVPLRAAKDSQLNDSARRVLMVICSCLLKGQWRTWPIGQRTLADLSGIDRYSLYRPIVLLEKHGYIKKRDAGQKGSVYTVLSDETEVAGLQPPPRQEGGGSTTATGGGSTTAKVAGLQPPHTGYYRNPSDARALDAPDGRARSLFLKLAGGDADTAKCMWKAWKRGVWSSQWPDRPPPFNAGLVVEVDQAEPTPESRQEMGS
jgi:hypothetical protein